MPMFIPVDITENVVEYVAWELSGSMGSGDTDSESLHGWLLKLGKDRKRLCTSVETFVDWIENKTPSWGAYRVFVCGRLIAPDKQPGVHLIGVGETWRLLFANCVLKVTGSKSTRACQDDQHCAGLKARIYGAVHGDQDICDTKLTIEDWVFIPLDAKRFQQYQLN